MIPTTAAEFLIYRPRSVPRDAVVGISSSGEFKDVVAVAEALRGRTPIAGIVHVPGSTLTQVASDIVISAGGPSVVPVMTKTFSSTLVATELLLLELLGGARASRRVAAILVAADAAEAAIAAAEPLVEALAATLVDARHLFVTGGGRRLPGRARGGAQAQGDGARPRRGRGGLGDDLRRRDDARA